MSILFALTLPGLVVALTVAGVIEMLVAPRRKNEPTKVSRPVASAGFDVLGLTLAPQTKHRIEFDKSSRMLREDEADGAPPRSKVDLDAGIATIVIPTRESEPRTNVRAAP
jgi:hypothetical protein